MNISRVKEYTDRLVRYFVDLLDDNTVDSHFLKQNIVAPSEKTARVQNFGANYNNKTSYYNCCIPVVKLNYSKHVSKL